MNGMGGKEEVGRLQKELSLAGVETDRRILELRLQVDRLKLEMTALKTFLGDVYPSFKEQYPQILAETFQRVDPESD